MGFYTEEQEIAIDYCTSLVPIFSIIGKAGTGKTQLMQECHKIFTNRGYNVHIVGPTGRNIKSIEERTGLIGKTIHRELEFPLPDEIIKQGMPEYLSKEPRRNFSNPLDCDVIFADEYSMVPWMLHEQFFAAFPKRLLLRIFGDIRQLKPIETDKNVPPYSPFEYLLSENPYVNLQKIHRNNDNIISNADKILNNQYPISNDDFTLLEVKTNNILNTLEEWIEYCKEDLNINYLNSLDNQIITPSNKNYIGVIELNKYFVNKMYAHDNTGWYKLPRHKWEKDDVILVKPGIKVIQTKNDYGLGVFNGETGLVQKINSDNSVYVDFGDKIICYPYKVITVDDNGFERYTYPQANLFLGYVVSTHKSQGSQFSHVIYIMDKKGYMTQCVSNFYTGVTRTKKTCTVISDTESLYRSITNI